jgi:hypothetical protein
VEIHHRQRRKRKNSAIAALATPYFPARFLVSSRIAIPASTEKAVRGNQTEYLDRQEWKKGKTKEIRH